tara:strand:- start:1226 stop:2434 length:1209 start_codon:yes stop_codon:yes gene_type:complete
MPEKLKVFQNIVAQEVPVAETTVPLVTTSSTERAVIKDVDCIDLGANVTLDLDGRSMATGDSLGVLTRTKKLVVDTNSVLSLKFPSRANVGFRGMFFGHGGIEGNNYIEGGPTVMTPQITSISTGADASKSRTSGFVHVHSVTGDITFFAILNGMVYEHNHLGQLLTSFPFGTSSTRQMCTDGIYMYGVTTTSTFTRRHIESGVTDSFTCAPNINVPADNQGSYTLYHNGKLYNKGNGGHGYAQIITLTGNPALNCAVQQVTNNDLAVGGYSDGATVVTTVAGVPYIVEQGTNYFTYWNLDTDVVTKVASGSTASTEYGNGACEVSPGVALIFCEHDDRIVIIDMNESPPAWSTSKWQDGNPYSTVQASNCFGNKFTIAGGIVPIAPRSFSALVSGVTITES